MEPGTKCKLTNFNSTCIALLMVMDPITQNETVARGKNMKTVEATEVNGCSVWVKYGWNSATPSCGNPWSSDLWLKQASNDLLQTRVVQTSPNSCFCGVFKIIKFPSAWQFCVLSATVCSSGWKSALENYDGAAGQKDTKRAEQYGTNQLTSTQLVHDVT